MAFCIQTFFYHGSEAALSETNLMKASLSETSLMKASLGSSEAARKKSSRQKKGTKWKQLKLKTLFASLKGRLFPLTCLKFSRQVRFRDAYAALIIFYH